MHVHLGSTYVLCAHASMNRHTDIINISSNLLNIYYVPETVNTVIRTLWLGHCLIFQRFFITHALLEPCCLPIKT